MQSVVPTGSAAPNVFVHLAENKDAVRWRKNWESGSLVGINDPSPYGYARAETMGCNVKFSASKPENPARRVLRLGLRVLLGFDYLHARDNAADIMAADVVWTHTESQFLAVAALLATRKGPSRPALLGQAVWLYDKWPRLSRFRRMFYRRLVREVDLLVTHSPENLRVAREVFPETRSRLFLFGIPSEAKQAPRRRTQFPAKVLCVGSDRHRDWRSAVEAFGGRDEYRLRIMSGSVSPKIARGHDNVRIAAARTQSELMDAYAEASLVLVPLKPNLHASGITVMQEAAVCGVPMVVSDTGGLRAYFGDDEVCYVPPGDPVAMRDAARKLLDDPSRMARLARNAQARMGQALGSDSYIRKHVLWTLETVKAWRDDETKASGGSIGEPGRRGLASGVDPDASHGRNRSGRRHAGFRR